MKVKSRDVKRKKLNEKNGSADLVSEHVSAGERLLFYLSTYF